MNGFGLTIKFDGQENVVLCNGVVKRYPVGGMVCELMRLVPSELKVIVDSYPGKDDLASEETFMKAHEWLNKRLIKSQDTITATALIILTEFMYSYIELSEKDDEVVAKHLEELHKENKSHGNEETMYSYILKGTGTDRLKIDTIGHLLSYCYYCFSELFSLSKATFLGMLAENDPLASEQEIKLSEHATEAFCAMCSPDSHLQQIDYCIMNIEGKLSSMFTIQNSISLLIFETTHMIEQETIISRCKNCKNFFVPENRADEVYCNFPAPQDKERTCRMVGANITRKAKEKKDIATHEFRKIYMRNKMQSKRHPDNQRYKDNLSKLVEGNKVWRKKLQDDPSTQKAFLEWLNQYDT